MYDLTLLPSGNHKFLINRVIYSESYGNSKNSERNKERWDKPMPHFSLELIPIVNEKLSDARLITDEYIASTYGKSSLFHIIENNKRFITAGMDLIAFLSGKVITIDYDARRRYNRFIMKSLKIDANLTNPVGDDDAYF